MRKKEIEALIQKSFVLHDGFYYTEHARNRMVERRITIADVEDAYLTGGISKIEIDTGEEIKVCWDGKGCDGEIIRIVMAYLKETKTLVITVIGDIYGK
ncbi:MAG: hypothetical protein A2504_01050 [Bdellovibrionales bacterium RIFOXYD12_FULL_39_22]|nr:MAG: hypothetical protein A2385_01940 [Bdellovibrionales bacterium RIFOXYB1_FULL_39_21]OFZ42694.1 MAG: hypothetical protein A2485_10125 [Bdellovibrionales bacterium RIFOXYC12_FULL_39_17]OFZ47253.1 MAG: hypothetical protein A2404_14730 [Bdellovibrionales bacterium RIFOXYC1_FULL_39_130]OFZ75419.1 MAG: hypothetical protein A2560_04000 [Bdellovibrionales bacterium RIFOXYD1_FULL_39_84]OFZ93373.1 MAG: hypothetical protein A2504_01050 [Bdellovibrionales bacterium RIFOXYD12_FULL_39_22]HLE12344.1 DU